MTSKATLGAGRTQSPSAFKTLPPARPGKPFSFANRLRQPLFHPIVFLSGFLLIFSRRPDAVSNAQFFAEDGQRWFADAYQLGLRCLLIPDQAGGCDSPAPATDTSSCLYWRFWPRCCGLLIRRGIESCGSAAWRCSCVCRWEFAVTGVIPHSLICTSTNMLPNSKWRHPALKW